MAIVKLDTNIDTAELACVAMPLAAFNVTPKN